MLINTSGRNNVMQNLVTTNKIKAKTKNAKALLFPILKVNYLF